MSAEAPKKIDIHTHAFSAKAAEFVSSRYDFQSEPMYRYTTANTQRLAEQDFEIQMGNLTRLEGRIADMDRGEVDAQLISPAPPQYYYGAPAAVGVESARIINDDIAALTSQRPDRFYGLGTVPLQDTDSAIREMHRCVRDLGLKGVEIGTRVVTEELASPRLLPFFQEAEKLGILLFMHPTGFTSAERFSEYHLNNIIGNPLDTTIAVSNLIFSGTLAKVPKLKMLLAHGGGYIASYVGRMEHAYHFREDSREKISEPPSTYLKRLFVDTVVFDEMQLRALVSQFGARHVAMGTDYPFDMGEVDPVGFVRRSLSEPDWSDVAGGTAAMLLGLA